MGVAPGQNGLRLGVLGFVFGAADRQKILYVARVPEERVAELVDFVSDQKFALLTAFSTDTVIVRRCDDENAIEQFSILAIGVLKGLVDERACGRSSLPRSEPYALALKP
jgi:hypothetical protein